VSTKTTRSGGKYTGSHTTIIPEAAKILDEIHGWNFVKKIALGLIKSTKRRGGSQLRLHPREFNGPAHGLQITISKGGSLQEVYIYLEDHTTLKYVSHRLEQLC